MVRSDAQSILVLDSFRCAIRFGAQFVSASISFSAFFVRRAFLFPLSYIITSLSKQESNKSEEPYLVCFVSPAAFRVVVIVVVVIVVVAMVWSTA